MLSCVGILSQRFVSYRRSDVDSPVVGVANVQVTTLTPMDTGMEWRYPNSSGWIAGLVVIFPPGKNPKRNRKILCRRAPGVNGGVKNGVRD